MKITVFGNLRTNRHAPDVFDGRNLYDSKLARSMGFEYLAIGR